MKVIGCVARVAVAAVALLATAASSAADPEAIAPAVRPDVERGIAADRIEQARRQVLDAGHQPELPRYRSGNRPGDSAERGNPGRRADGALREARRRAMIDTRQREEPTTVSSLMTMVMWGMVIVVVLLAAFWLASELSRYGGDAELPPDEPHDHVRADAAIIERPLGDADELARRGLFAEAIHTLLLRTLQELARSAAVRVAPATTSREILARVPLLADSRSALAGLITAVEVTYFGDEPANAADYERCRQQFHVFAAVFRNAGAGSQAAAA